MNAKADNETLPTWFKKHSDTVIILGAILSSFLWMHGKFNALENRLTRIETVMILKGIMPDTMVKDVKLGQ